MTRIDIELGSKPWEPMPGTRMVEVLDFYNYPLAGIVEHGSQSLLFICAAGEEDDVSVWFYVALNDEDLAMLAKSDEESLIEDMSATLQNRIVTGALVQDWSILNVGTVDAGVENPGVLVRRFLDRMLAQIERTEHGVTAMLRKSERDEELATA